VTRPAAVPQGPARPCVRRAIRTRPSVPPLPTLQQVRPKEGGHQRVPLVLSGDRKGLEGHLSLGGVAAGIKAPDQLDGLRAEWCHQSPEVSLRCAYIGSTTIHACRFARMM
jgi:hypothetical protein